MNSLTEEWQQHPILVRLRWPCLVALLAHLVYVQLLLNVARARYKHKIWPPAISGHPDFDRIFRVQANFNEQYPSFMFSLLFCALFINGEVAGVLGLIWVVCRFFYSRRYSARRLKYDVLWYTGPQYGAVGLMLLLPAIRIILSLVIP
eukprot:TRINITY_DN2393_c0_g1_i1.p1 TRINITY_DN2393_c0_g1~~TRINITY_DN2393_c0_g1_i1.p1  ORF type:complete len:148 (-),score=13.90 TRINITY_DN2393_c0_g1_i1:138-581(-)